MRQMSLLCVAAMLACDVAGPAPTPMLHEVGAANGCAAVAFSIDIVRVGFGVQEGTMTGDLVGTARGFPVPGYRTGRAFHSTVGYEFTVTGGAVPDLIGRVIDTEGRTDVISVRVPDQPGVFRAQGTVDVVSGAEGGRLTFHGTSNFPAGFRSLLDFNGQICP